LNVNVTVCPLGKPPSLVSVAVNFTDLPDVDGFGVDVSVIVICAGFTVCVIADEVLFPFD
jgi:hypothetical protein